MFHKLECCVADAEDEADYQCVRKAVKEYRVTMKEYYKAVCCITFSNLWRLYCCPTFDC